MSESSSSSSSSSSSKIQINFPDEIVEEILSRLPVDLLLQFRCVSKSWRSLIDSEKFIKFHLKKSTENKLLSHHRILLSPRDNGRDKLLEMISWGSLLKEPIVDPFQCDDLKDINSEVEIVGCCGGLVCLIQGMGRFILWNPATRMSLNLPYADAKPMTIMSVVGDKFHMFGFGYDESTDDYKVFTAVFSNNYVVYPPLARIYSLKGHSWKTVVEGSFPYCWGDDAGRLVNGNLHWFGKEEDRPIISFDLKNEEFAVFEQPKYPNDNIFVTQTLGVMEGCLSLLCGYRDSHFDVWIMKEYGVKESWVNIYTIPNINHPPLRRERVRSFCRGPNGEVLLIYNSNLIMCCYYPEVYDEFYCSLIINIQPIMGEGVYVESLASLGPHAEEESF